MEPVPRLFSRTDCGAGRDFIVLTSDKKVTIVGSFPSQAEAAQVAAELAPVIAAHSQFHHDYTVTLPEVFGHYFYHRGGAVDTRLDHTHDPLVAVFGVWWDWDEVSRARRAQDIQAICAALAAPQSPITEHLSKHYVTAYRAVPDSGEYPLTIAALFSDLVLGCEAVRQVLAAYPCSVRLKIFESFSGKEPLAFVRSAKDEEE